MCKETFQLTGDMNMQSLEVQLVLQCAPTITGLRLSNLFIIPAEMEGALRALLRCSGISCYRLKNLGNKRVFLLYRRCALEKYLSLQQVRDILFSLGYEDLSFGGILRRFSDRYIRYVDLGADFPHEMGLLLGYPWEDVRGFMELGGDAALYTGYWKVYSDVSEKKKLFHLFDRAETHLIRLLKENYDFPSILEIYHENRKRIAV